MRFRLARLLLVVALAALSLQLAGCGSSKHSTARKAAIVGAAAATIHHHHKTAEQHKATAAGNYKVGEFCSTKNNSLYKKAGLTCAKEKNSYRLQKL